MPGQTLASYKRDYPSAFAALTKESLLEILTNLEYKNHGVLDIATGFPPARDDWKEMWTALDGSSCIMVSDLGRDFYTVSFLI